MNCAITFVNQLACLINDSHGEVVAIGALYMLPLRVLDLLDELQIDQLLVLPVLLRASHSILDCG